ncbi:MAG: alpha/beta hydrolase [Legionellaceae bacterium]|nr:alpha/beta hydrolase [Legionellaceae bacterium]
MMQDNMTLTLPDGRTLGYAAYGEPTGCPVFYFHGFPGSRLQVRDFHQIAQAKNCQIVGIDRPGMGLSDFNKRHTLMSWSDDVSALADSLNIKKFSIIAHSGGAPFALACGAKLAARVSHIALVSAMPPWTEKGASKDVSMGFRTINTLVRNIPGFALLLMQLQKNVLLKPAMFERLIQQVPAVDGEVLKANHGLLVAAKEAFRQGVSGAASEFRLITKQWGFKLEDILCPISIWQGALDTQVPVASAKFLAFRLPHARLNLMKKDAHQSTLYHCMAAILEASVS